MLPRAALSGVTNVASESGTSVLATALIVLVKLLAIVVGFVTTVLSLMAVVGLVAESAWVRVPVALLVALVPLLFIADRLLPADGSKPAPGLISDVFALGWLIFGFVFCVPLTGYTSRWLSIEADRLASSGNDAVATVTYWLAGVDDVLPPPAPSSPPAAPPVVFAPPASSEAAPSPPSSLPSAAPSPQPAATEQPAPAQPLGTMPAPGPGETAL